MPPIEILSLFMAALLGGCISHIFGNMIRKVEEKTRILKEFRAEIENLKSITIAYWSSSPENNNEQSRIAEINTYFNSLPKRFEALNYIYGNRDFDNDFMPKYLNAHALVTGGSFATKNREHGAEFATERASALVDVINSINEEIDTVRSQNIIRKLKII